MHTFILVVHVLACLMLILTVMLQSGKGSAMGVFGGSGGGDALFAASSGTSFVKKFTMTVALTIAVTSVLLTIFRPNRARSVLERDYAPVAPVSSPAAPAAAPAATPAAPATK